MFSDGERIAKSRSTDHTTEHRTTIPGLTNVSLDIIGVMAKDPRVGEPWCGCWVSFFLVVLPSSSDLSPGDIRRIVPASFLFSSIHHHVRLCSFRILSHPGLSAGIFSCEKFNTRNLPDAPCAVSSVALDSRF